MPELPDVEVYVEALRERVLGRVLDRVILCSPFLLRSAGTPLESAHGHAVRDVRRVGKRIALGFEPGPWLALHLMIAGRLHWRESGTNKGARKPGSKGLLAIFEFDSGSLYFTEAGSQHREPDLFFGRGRLWPAKKTLR